MTPVRRTRPPVVFSPGLTPDSITAAPLNRILMGRRLWPEKRKESETIGPTPEMGVARSIHTTTPPRVRSGNPRLPHRSLDRNALLRPGTDTPCRVQTRGRARTRDHAIPLVCGLSFLPENPTPISDRRPQRPRRRHLRRRGPPASGRHHRLLSVIRQVPPQHRGRPRRATGRRRSRRAHHPRRTDRARARARTHHGLLPVPGCRAADRGSRPARRILRARPADPQADPQLRQRLRGRLPIWSRRPGI